VISVIKITDGSYNLIGTANGMFVLQGNLTEEELTELEVAIKEVREE
jgi:hypothetical protein